MAAGAPYEVWCSFTHSRAEELASKFFNVKLKTPKSEKKKPQLIQKHGVSNYICASLSIAVSQAYPALLISPLYLTRYIGGGHNGTVFGCRDRVNPHGGERAIKFSKHEVKKDGWDYKLEMKEMGFERNAQLAFHAHGLAPAVVGGLRVTERKKVVMSCYEMSKIDGTAFELIVGMDQASMLKPFEERKEGLKLLAIKILKLMDKTAEVQYTHGDLHWKNIGFTRIGDRVDQLFFIDFGWSTLDFNFNFVDLLQLIRTTFKVYWLRRFEEDLKESDFTASERKDAIRNAKKCMWYMGTLFKAVFISRHRDFLRPPKLDSIEALTEDRIEDLFDSNHQHYENQRFKRHRKPEKERAEQAARNQVVVID